MSDRDQQAREDSAATQRDGAQDVDALRLDEGPLKTEGDALRDGSGSRHGQSPPNVDPAEPR